MVRPIREIWTIWRGLALALLLGLVAWNHQAAILDILHNALRRPDQSQILLAPIIAAWLAWLRRSRLRSLRIVPSLWGPVLIVAGWLLYWGGVRTDFQLGQHASVLVSGLGCVVSVVGFDIVRRFAPAFLALLFVLPIPGTLRVAMAQPLQDLATGVTYLILQLLRVDVVRETGRAALSINGRIVEVGEACNGMRLVFALFLTVYAFAFSMPLRQSVRIVLIGLSPFVALVCNVIRLIPTSLLYALKPESAQLFHDISGWVMLPIALFLLLGVLRVIRWTELPVMSFRLAMRT